MAYKNKQEIASSVVFREDLVIQLYETTTIVYVVPQKRSQDLKRI